MTWVRRAEVLYEVGCVLALGRRGESGCGQEYGARGPDVSLSDRVFGPPQGDVIQGSLFVGKDGNVSPPSPRRAPQPGSFSFYVCAQVYILTDIRIQISKQTIGMLETNTRRLLEAEAL